MKTYSILKIECNIKLNGQIGPRYEGQLTVMVSSALLVYFSVSALLVSEKNVLEIERILNVELGAVTDSYVKRGFHFTWVKHNLFFSDPRHIFLNVSSCMLLGSESEVAYLRVILDQTLSVQA